MPEIMVSRLLCEHDSTLAAGGPRQRPGKKLRTPWHHPPMSTSSTHALRMDHIALPDGRAIALTTLRGAAGPGPDTARDDVTHSTRWIAHQQ
jgi:hypothetical protein